MIYELLKIIAAVAFFSLLGIIPAWLLGLLSIYIENKMRDFFN